MNKRYTKIALCLISMLTMLLISEPIAAQCNALTLTLQPTNSTCLANGKIKVIIGGADAGNIDPNRVEFMVSGTVNYPFSTYTNNTIENLPAGTFTIQLRAFCNSSQSWVVATTTATTTLSTSYKELVVSLGAPRLSLSCKPTGMIPVNIGASTGSAPFKIEIVNAPVTYSGPVAYTNILSRNFEVPNLPVGPYTIRITDDCGYEVNRTTTVGLFDIQNYLSSLFYMYFYPRTPIALNNCNEVSFYRNSYSSTTSPNEYHYFNSNAADYFEIAFVDNNTNPGSKVYNPLSNGTQRMNYTLPTTMKLFRQGNQFVAPYLRVIGGVGQCEYQLNNVSIYPSMSHSVETFAVGCSNTINVNHIYYEAYYQLICYPFKWKIVDSSNNDVIGWQGPVNAYNITQSATNIPLGSKILYEDAEGYAWTYPLPSTLPYPTISTSNQYSFTYPRTDGYYPGYFSLYFNSKFPPGTTFQYVPAAGNSTPVHTNFSVLDSVIQVYPFSSNFLNYEYVHILPGSYTFTVTMPGCAPRNVVANYSCYRLIDEFTYTTEEVCDGLNVMPSGGRMDYVYYNGTASQYSDNNNNMYYRIYSSIPSNLPYDRNNVVLNGGTLKLPVQGKYVIAMCNNNSSSATPHYTDTIEYIPTPFTLDNTVTSSYLCQGDVTGFIRVQGAGGTGDYRYDLYDNTTLVASNTTGIFNYGVAGNTYRVVLNDTTCMASYPQDVTLLDLGIAQIAFSSSPDDKFCLTDSVFLKCITLGETIYTWSGPGINSANEHQQNPALFAGDLGVGAHIFTVRVTPENCGVQMQQTVTVTIADCRPVADSALIIANGATICTGDPITLSVSLTSSVIQDPVFSWYSAPTGGAAFHTGASYTPSPSLTTTTTYYVSVKGSSHQESERKAVTVTVKPFSTPDMIKITVN